MWRRKRGWKFRRVKLRYLMNKLCKILYLHNIWKAFGTNWKYNSADLESTDRLDKFAYDSAHKASNNFRALEGGFKAKKILFY
jgi:hypothetical protein